MRHVLSGLCLLVALLALAAPPVAAQGRTDYLNVESPQVHPIEVVTLAGHDYLLAVNTPDNSVEIWDTDESLPVAARLLDRVRTGLEPVSVRWVAELGTFFVANFLGDSVSAVRLEAPGGPTTLSATVERTVWVGDEPMDIAFFSFDETDPTTGEVVTQNTLFVTHMTLDAVGWYDAGTLLARAPGFEFLVAEVNSGQDLDHDGAIDQMAVKEPRAVAVRCDQLFIQGFKGGNTPFYDFDLYAADLVNGGTRAVGGIGSTNYNMAFTADDDLYAVGGEALNNSLFDEPNVAAAPTGFVKSMFYLIENPCTANPTVHRRDVNLVPEVLQEPFPKGAVAEPVMKPAAFNQALAQPTDVVPFERQGQPTKVFFTAFGSDRIGVIEPNPGQSPNLWPLRRIGVTPDDDPRAGPRGLALKTSAPERLYVLNRLDNSISVIDPVAEAFLTTFDLSQDPQPDYIRQGREFLYSADLSGNGFVSCASCHTDARTDGLGWDLGTPANPPEPVPPLLNDNATTPQTTFRADKEFMVTQTLQSLLDFEVEPASQDLFTNAPYHWRGDRADFTRFNPAFVGLLGREMELETGEMEAFETFINSVQYAGNPKQSIARVYSGDLGAPDDPFSGDGALRGLKLFHIVDSDGMACVHCHHLPVGSNTRLTETLNLPAAEPTAMALWNGDPLPEGVPNPIETAQLRNLFQREARRDLNGSSDHAASPVTGLEGLTHTGFFPPVAPTTEVPDPPSSGPDGNQLATINAFNRFFFGLRLCGPGSPFCLEMQQINQYMHEFDWGVSPAVGIPITATAADLGNPPVLANIAFGEGQVHEANMGLAVQAWIGGVRRGFWYDATVQTPVYREEPGGATFVDATALIGLLGPDDLLVFVAVPLGSERRVASPSGSTAPLDGSAPTEIELLPMVPNTANEQVPSMVAFWEHPNPQPIPTAMPPLTAADVRKMHGGAFSHSVRLFQHGLVQNAPAGSNAFGAAVRHEAPRRFRVRGRFIRHGAHLELLAHDQPPDDDGTPPPPPQTGLRPSVPGQVALRTIRLPLHPVHETGEIGDDDQIPALQIWETAAEMAQIFYLRLMLGGPFAPGVDAAFFDQGFQIDEPPDQSLVGMFDPANWNFVWVRVVNADGTLGNGGWQRVTIQ